MPDSVKNKSPFGSDTQKYWDIRYDIFSRFDEGIRIDREGLYSVKPEKISNEIARFLPGSNILDAFCGIGGSAIAFAQCKSRVFAVDNNQRKLEMAKHNADLYGVFDKIQFIHADIKELLLENTLPFDSIYFDPSWGGPDYYKKELFNLDMFDPDGGWLIEFALNIGVPFAITVPINFNIQQLFNLGRSFFVQWHELNGANVFATVYFNVTYDLSTSCGTRLDF
jgi:trimethylguanosine synthase